MGVVATHRNTSRNIRTILLFFVQKQGKMSLVNGYRIKCQSYKRMAEREKEMRRREEKLGNWSFEKASRKAAIKKLHKKLQRGSSTESQSTLSSSASASSDWSSYTDHTGLIGDQEKQGGGQVVSQHLED